MPVATKIPYRLWELFDYNGKLAMSAGHRYEEDDTGVFCWRHIKLSNIPADMYPGIVGQVPWDQGRAWAWGQVRLNTGSYITLDTRAWPEQAIKEPVAKPRNGKTYTWKWSQTMNMWIKDFFPYCQDCRHNHNPTMVHCDWCGVAINPKVSAGTLCKDCGNRHED